MDMPSQEEIKKAYGDGATRAPSKYKEKVMRNTSWKERAGSADAENLYGQKVQQAVAERSRQKGLEGVTQEEWRSKASNVGAARIGQGMQNAVGKQAANYEKTRQAFAALELPAKTADPMANIDNRLKKVVQTAIDANK